MHCVASNRATKGASFPRFPLFVQTSYVHYLKLDDPEVPKGSSVKTQSPGTLAARGPYPRSEVNVVY